MTQASARRMLLALLASLSLANLAFASAQQTDPDESDFLSKVRRLTYEGRRAGEGYFSPSGQQMVFQSERVEGNPFYQIFVLDLGTGDTRQVSPGIGKTTCGFIRPGTGEVLYASSHLDPRAEQKQVEEIEARASGEERRYAWDYEPQMDLFSTDPDGETTQLTETLGYDAEASYSPDGQWIVFTSNRSAFEGTLSEAHKKQFEVDPAYFNELYRMPAVGGEAQRLTHTPGYDGGPFFFPDGSRIIWRRFDEQGLTADIWSAKPDGSDARQLTNFSSMSWAPYVHPSGEYVLFASNKLGFSNFEIYMVDVDGKKQPVRITTSEGFDGLPVPSPDGKQLSWTSTRHGGDGGQIYLADWNHAAALKALQEAPLREKENEQ